MYDAPIMCNNTSRPALHGMYRHRRSTVAKVMEGVQPKQAAQIRLVFQDVDVESTGCADAEVYNTASPETDIEVESITDKAIRDSTSLQKLSSSTCRLHSAVISLSIIFPLFRAEGVSEIGARSFRMRLLRGRGSGLYSKSERQRVSATLYKERNIRLLLDQRCTTVHERDIANTSLNLPQLLLSELHTSFSHNDGHVLEALHPGLLSAVAEIVEASPKDGHAQDVLDKSGGRIERRSPPITWEEVRGK